MQSLGRSFNPRGVIGSAAFLAILLWPGGNAYPADDPSGAGDSDWYREIPSSEPYLPNRPMRRENISDEEVREVQEAALQVYPDFIVVISGVTDGCACEEGRQCSAQVGLALNRDNVTRSLVLSRMDGHWKVGAVQSWWLKFREFERTHPRPTNWDALQNWERARQALLKQFPACPVPTANWVLLRNASYGSTYVDPSSLKVSGYIRRVNFRNVYPVHPIPYFPLTRFSIALQAFDCKDRRTRIDRQTAYFTDGTARPLSVIDPVLWDPVGVGTEPAADLDLVCRWKVQEPP